MYCLGPMPCLKCYVTEVSDSNRCSAADAGTWGLLTRPAGVNVQPSASVRTRVGQVYRACAHT